MLLIGGRLEWECFFHFTTLHILSLKEFRDGTQISNQKASSETEPLGKWCFLAYFLLVCIILYPRPTCPMWSHNMLDPPKSISVKEDSVQQACLKVSRKKVCSEWIILTFVKLLKQKQAKVNTETKQQQPLREKSKQPSKTDYP